MKKDLSVELGRANLCDNGVIVTLGKSSTIVDDLQINAVIGLDTKKTPENKLIVDIFANGQLVAKGQPKVIKNSIGCECMSVVINEIVNESRDILSLTKNQLIELDTKLIFPEPINRPTYSTFLHNIFANNCLIGKGIIFSVDNNLAIRIVEIVNPSDTTN